VSQIPASLIIRMWVIPMYFHSVHLCAVVCYQPHDGLVYIFAVICLSCSNFWNPCHRKFISALWTHLLKTHLYFLYRGHLVKVMVTTCHSKNKKTWVVYLWLKDILVSNDAECVAWGLRTCYLHACCEQVLFLAASVCLFVCLHKILKTTAEKLM